MPTCPLFLLSTIMTRFAKALFIVSLVILGFSHTLAKSKTDICIMTYNIRLSADDGVNKWTNRSADNIKMLEYYSPDLIGMQEVRPDQLADLDANLPSYGHVGAGRDDGKNEGEHCPIFYKKNRFVLIESGNFALSENPNAYGVKGWDASYPRIATWAILKDRKTGKKIAYFNTHLDNDGVKARREGIKLVLERAKQIAPKLPLLISGDFNCTDATAPFDILNAAGLKSIYQLSPIVHGPNFSYHDYGRAKPEELELLDYVFVSKAFDVKRCRVIQDKPEGHYLSDHYPVIAQIQY